MPNVKQRKSNKNKNKIGKNQRSRMLLSNAKRSPDTIISALTKSMNKASIGNNAKSQYHMCMLNPFLHKAEQGIPDGSNANYVVIDSYTADTIGSIGSHEFIIQTLPFMPCTAGIASLGSINVNGISITANTSYDISSTDPKSSLYPLAVPAAWRTSPYYTPGQEQDDPYNSSTCRWVAVGYRLIYTGPATTCAGVITVTPNDVGCGNFNMISTSVTGVANTWAFHEVTPTGVSGGATPIGTPVVQADIHIDPNSFTSQTMTFRPEQGVSIFPKHKGSSYIPKPTNNPVGIIGPGRTDTSETIKYSLLKSEGDEYSGGIVWYDDSWSCYTIRASGLNSDATFRLETVVIAEFNIQQNSAIATLANKQSPSKPSDFTKVQADIGKKNQVGPVDTNRGGR